MPRQKMIFSLILILFHLNIAKKLPNFQLSQKYHLRFPQNNFPSKVLVEEKLSQFTFWAFISVDGLMDGWMAISAAQVIKAKC